MSDQDRDVQGVGAPGVDTRPAPLVLLDVDGVLNALAGRPDAGVWPDWRRGSAVADGTRWPITWSPSVVDAVRRWQAGDQAQVQWLTTWGHHANGELRNLIGLPELRVAGTYGDEQAWQSRGSTSPGTGAHSGVAPAARDELSGRWWKFDCVRRLLLSEPRPLVWLDDDLVGEDDIRAWVQARAECLLIAPKPQTGLTAADLDAVDDFLRSAARAG